MFKTNSVFNVIDLDLKTIANVVQAPLSEAFDQQQVKGCVIDSRQVLPGNLFIAIKGENFDGHDFVEQARAAGAAAAVVSQATSSDLPQLVVNDTVKALGQLAAAWRDRFTTKWLAVTGSNGKTTVKDMIYAILSQPQPKQVLATKGNFNNHIGLPLTLLRLESQHAYGVIEMGMNHFGEIAYLTGLTRPDVAVITNAANSHLEGVGGTVAGVAKAKGEIFQGLSDKGVAILNKMDSHFDYWCHLLGAQQQVMSFGLTPDAMFHAKCYNTAQNANDRPTVSFVLVCPDGEIPIALPLFGEHNVLNALAAAAATRALGISLAQIKAGIETICLAPGRLQWLKSQAGSVVLNDTYNANPFSLNAALEALSQYDNAGKKILVLGDMVELGETAALLHQQAGTSAKEKGIDAVLCVGDLTKNTATAFGEGASHFKELSSLVDKLRAMAKANDCVLVKGSRSMKMERVVEALTED